MVKEYYTVRDAIADLQELDPDLPLILSPDDEGNDLRMVNSIGIQFVRELVYRDMETIAEDDVDEYDNPVKVAEVW